MPKEKVPSWVLPDTAPPAPEPTMLDTLGDYAGVATRALAPYATAGAVGAAAGAPFAGVGAAPGAAGGVTVLGLGDLAAGVYNLAAPVFGGQRVPLPSETIQNQFGRIGVGRAPTTPAQQVFSDVVQAGAGGLSQALGAKTLAPVMASPRARNFMQFLGQNVRGQTGAALGGAVAPSVAANYFDVSDPWALMSLSLAGGAAGGRAATPKITIPSVSELKTQANAAYDAAKQAGVRVSQPALAQLNSDINAELQNLSFIPGSHPEVRRRLTQIQQEFRGPMDFSRLDSLHSDIAAAARKAGNDKTRMYMEAVAHKIDDFLTNLAPNQVTSGNAGAATSAVERARGLWRSKSQLSLLDGAVDAARNTAQQGGAGFGEALRNEYRKILRSKQFGRLSPEVQDAVKLVANGTPSSRAVDILSKLSPTNKQAVATEMLTAGGVYGLTQHTPMSILVPGAMAATGAAAKPIANRMAMSQAQRARMTAAGIKPNAPFYRGNMALPTAQQVTQAPQRGAVAQQRRDVLEPPWWAVGNLP